MADRGDRTLSLTGSPSSGAARAEPYLVLSLSAGAPLEPSLRVRLNDIDLVNVGRGDQGSAQRVDEAGLRGVELRLADLRASSKHVQLSRALGRWVLEDLGSKNGTRVNGQTIERVTLEDGDVIEVGHSFLVFRGAVAGAAGGPLFLDARDLDPRPPGCRTLHAAHGRALDALSALAASDVAIVLRGETGTGKEVVARSIHAQSGRTGPLVAINCGALTPGLVESELFGHKRGAFTGAADDRLGLVRSAEGGTLFLDEVGDLPAPAQASLLRVLQEKEVLPVGATRPVPVDFRVIAATHRDLEEMIGRGDFRADLYARLSGFTLSLPPLRERREDLGILIAAFLGPRGAVPPIRIEAARALFTHPWPLNVRELEKALETARVLAGTEAIALEHLPEPLQHSARGAGAEAEEVPLPAEDLERRAALVLLLREHQGNVSAVARAMGKARMQIQRWIKRYKITPDNYR
ncbi:MAG: sigma 54-interacting transcriptional regulator [Deltaproteobacteria bacterium]|nr:sigma 54-interacting transcriptional regulator [Deltaproteobacteria bacterium]